MGKRSAKSKKSNSPSNIVKKEIKQNSTKWQYLLALATLTVALSWTKLSSLFQDVGEAKADANSFLIGSEPGVTILDQSLKPSTPIFFSVHFNGDGLSSDYQVSSNQFKDLDEMIYKYCTILLKSFDDDIDIPISKCEPANGARLFTHTGVRVYSFLNIDNNTRTYIVPQGIMFIFPLGNVGDVIYPENTGIPPVSGSPIKLIQLSESPRVYSVENFMSAGEMDEVIAFNKDKVKPSEVGFSGWKDKTRTSSTAWDTKSLAAKTIQKRAFDLVGKPYYPKQADAVQVLRYKYNKETSEGEWYKPHVDFFDHKGYDNHDPTITNGTNRFVTVFLYLSNVTSGGETVFPLSTTHVGYNPEERLVEKGTEKVAGYISSSDAKKVCSPDTSALRTKPVAGSAVMFYSQGPRGELDKMSLHGGCPVLGEEIKWSANVWLWNRPQPSKSAAKDSKFQGGVKVDPGNIPVRVFNNLGHKIGVYWQGVYQEVFQMEIDPDEISPLTTYEGHTFLARKGGKGNGKVIGTFTAKKSDQNQRVRFTKV